MDNNDGGAAGVASNMIWALAFIIVVGLIVGGLYYGGVLSGKTQRNVDIEIKGPSNS